MYPCRRLEQKDWWVIGSFDGLYKNSFMIFGRSEVRQSEMLSPSALPWTIALSVATTKKIRFDDASCLLRKTIDEPYNENTIDALTPLYAIGKPTKRQLLTENILDKTTLNILFAGRNSACAKFTRMS